jgi:mannitol-1-phosphate/altronate dehydrogenase
VKASKKHNQQKLLKNIIDKKKLENIITKLFTRLSNISIKDLLDEII